MRRQPFIGLVIWALGVSAGLAAPGLCDPPKAAATDEAARRAVNRGLDFLVKDAIKWREEKKCSTCHHGTMTVFALTEGKSRGYEVKDETFDDMTTWTKDRLLERIDLPRDTRPGWSMVNTPAIYLSLLALEVPKQDALTAEELNRIAGHLLRHQEKDGSWAWSSAPPQNRPPPFFESDEIATLLTWVALDRQPTGKDSTPTPSATDISDARKRAKEWLASATPNETTQAMALRLLARSRMSNSPKEMQSEIDRLLARRNADGGWGQLKDAPSDAYATGQALYVLSLAGVANDRDEVRRGVAFLTSSQKEDGSWAMTPRANPGANPSKNTSPITYFGSAWGTIGLMRSLPPAK